MDLSPVKYEILQALTSYDKPVKAAQVAKVIGKAVPSVQMHLIGLTKMGSVDSPEKGCYKISTKGKKALGLSQVTKEHAKAILAETSQEKAFQFYKAIDEPTDIYAKGLAEFCTKIQQAPVQSVMFHVNRGDFEAWFQSLGDKELAEKVTLLKEKKMDGEELRTKLSQLVGKRFAYLSTVA
jgi:DNA-binding transcriptional ArsR family regulator